MSTPSPLTSFLRPFPFSLPPFSLFLLTSFFLLTSCTPASPTPPAILRVQYTFATRPWLSKLNDCAGESALALEQRPVGLLDPQSADLTLRLGDRDLSGLAYQIDSEEIVVIVNPQNPVRSLSAGDVLALFTGAVSNWQAVGGKDAPVQVWVFARGEDLQQIFEATALGGAPVVSTARLAAGPEAMAQAVAGDVQAVGLLTRSLLAADVEAVYSAANVPVLVSLPAAPEGELANLVACLQK